MPKIGLKTANAALLCFVLSLSARLFAGDLKVKQRVTTVSKNAEAPKGSQDEETIYVQGARERREYKVPDTADALQPHTAEIIDCQSLSGYHVDFNTRKYAEMKLPGFPSEKQMHTVTRQQEVWARKRYAAQTIDTGERKKFFGRTARHIVTSIHGTTLEERSEATIDGWYVDLPQPGCSPDYMRTGKAAELHVTFLSTGASETVYTGFVPPGLAVEETITTRSRFDQKGFHREVVMVVEHKTIEISQEPLDAALFHAPEGFVRVERLPQNVNIPRPSLQTR